MNHLTLAIIDIAFLLAGLALGVFLTRKASVWLDSLHAMNLIGVLKKDLDEKAGQLKAIRDEVSLLKKRNLLLERQVKDLEETLAHREATIDELMMKLRARDEQISELMKQMQQFEDGKQAFERNLLKYLAMNFGTGPEEVGRELGIDIYESPSDND